VQVLALAGVIAIASHDHHTLALCGDGTVWAWGDNGRGQLGTGTLVSHSPVPVQVPNLDDVTAVAAGWGHSLALRGDGTVWAWGCLRHGSSPSAQQSPSPEDLLPRKIDIGNVIAIAAGGVNAAAIGNNGTVWTWENADESPAQVQELSGVTNLAVGANHFLALKSDGTLWGWGDNKFGQLGDGTTMDSDLPVQLIDFTGVTAIAAHEHSLALKDDGVVWGWGCNTQGQLGNGNAGTETSAATPGPVQSPFKRGLLRDNVLNLFDTHPWWRSMCGLLQFVFRYLLFGWLWM
jgi:alpha-tubulin suppressor-like RCC1 family protein